VYLSPTSTGEAAAAAAEMDELSEVLVAVLEADEERCEAPTGLMSR